MGCLRNTENEICDNEICNNEITNNEIIDDINVIDDSMNQFYFIFCKIKENYDTIMTPHNMEIINNNSMKNKFINMGFDIIDAECMTFALMFLIYFSLYESLD